MTNSEISGNLQTSDSRSGYMLQKWLCFRDQEFLHVVVMSNSSTVYTSKDGAIPDML